MDKALELTALGALAVVRLRGADAAKFLQGQVSNDTGRVSDTRSVLAGYHNPQGRAIALLRLVQWQADDILALVPRELAATVTTRLSKFVLRAKVKISDESAGWVINGIIDRDGVAGSVAGLANLPGTVGGQARVGDGVFVRVADAPARWLVVAPAEGTAPELAQVGATVATPPKLAQVGAAVPALAQISTTATAGTELDWRRLDVAAGLPQVQAATTEEFVAQMLNLDVLDAIAFDKGCYTGQEVIARAHYRGRVKRRMQRFVSREPVELEPGASGTLADGRAFKVVLAAQLGDGRCDFLAVAPFAGGAAEAADMLPTTSVTLAVDQLALPYALPE